MKLQMLLFVLVFFSLNSIAQTQVGNDIDGENIDDNSGWSISLSSDGNRVAIGAINSDEGGDNSGHVRIYEWDGSAWTQLGDDIDGEAMDDRFGHAVSLSEDGSIVAIGADQDDENGSNTGYASIYEWDGTSWTQLGDNIDGENTGDRFGRTISLSDDGSIVAIGADRNDGNGNDAGHIRIYELINGAWTQLGSDIEGELAGDRFGISISLSANGNRVAAGSDIHAGVGHVRIYDFDGTNWIQVGGNIDGENSVDFFGWSIDLSSVGNHIAIGAPFNDGNGNDAGHVRVYQLNDGAWMQIGNDIDGENANDVSGWSVSLSSDGSRVAIGAVLNNTVTGHTRVFELDNGDWSQVNSDMDGENVGDWFGYSVSLSANGERIAASGTFNDDGGDDAGHVRVFDLDTPLPVELIYFRGKTTESGNLLNWVTTSEFNNDRFVIEYSTNGIAFYPLGEVLGNSNSTTKKDYEFLHARLIGNTHYYRLKQVDFNGSFEYSNIISISSESNKITLYPNPTSGIVEIIGLNENAVIELSDSFGQQVNSILLNDNLLNLSNLPNGVYFIRIISTGQSKIIKVLKE